MKATFKVVNVVISLKPKEKVWVDLPKLTEKNGFFIPPNYPSVVHCRHKKIDGFVGVFNSGKMFSAGTKTIARGKKNLLFVWRLLLKQNLIKKAGV